MLCYNFDFAFSHISNEYTSVTASAESFDNCYPRHPVGPGAYL